MNHDIEKPRISLQTLITWYFSAYLVQLALYRIFTDSKITIVGPPAIHQMKFMVWSVIGSFIITLSAIAVGKWRNYYAPAFQHERSLIHISGICTAIVIPTTAILYTCDWLSLMVAGVIMRGAMIVTGWIVDQVQFILKIRVKRVAPLETIAAILGLTAIVIILYIDPPKNTGDSFWTDSFARWTLILYTAAYGVRIYIMNYYKNRRELHNVHSDERGYYGIENPTAALVLALAAVAVLIIGPGEGAHLPQTYEALTGILQPQALIIILTGTIVGLSAIPSVFLFLFPKESATFTTLVNRLTSLITATIVTLLLIPWGGRSPSEGEWWSLAFVVAAVILLVAAKTRASRDKS